MSQRLLEHFRSRIKISDEEFSLLLDHMEHKQVKKKEKLLEIGEVCNYTIYVNEGLLYSYSVDDDGNEHVVHFALEDYWISDLYSFLNRTPATVDIIALEDSDVYMFRYDKMNEMFEIFPFINTFYRQLYEKAYIYAQQLLDRALGISAIERYVQILKERPHLIQRVPLHLIASYLGITPETLSRIRRKLVKR
ncbi:MAG: Crp/Fnr family transcriptional regulator [Flavobacteriaceae bacterium]|jgi:CRP-like cAMP-binding protein|nr:Crp/Fnr family transcriptional regulator [Flavobacteriaceae bacterium]